MVGRPRDGAHAPASCSSSTSRARASSPRTRTASSSRFLIGFLSQSDADEAYIHFVGVAPEHRGSGIGRALYERFFTEVAEHGRSVVRCVTSPGNEGSIAFHESLGFTVDRIAKDYDGPGEDRVLFVKRLA